MVSFTTDLTGWVDRSWFPVFLVVSIDCVGIFRNFIVGVRVCLTPIIVVAGTIPVVLGLVSLSFELTALVSIMTWPFAVVATWFRFFWVLVYVLLRHTLSAAHMELSNHSVPTPFRDVTQSFHKCYSPNAPDYSIYSGGEAFWHK